MKRNTLQETMKKLTTPEALIDSYKETFPGITDADAAELADLFLKGMNGSNLNESMKPLRKKIAEATAKYGKRDPWEDLEMSFPDLDDIDFPDIDAADFPDLDDIDFPDIDTPDLDDVIVPLDFHDDIDDSEYPRLFD